MDANEYKGSMIRQMNRQIIAQDKECEKSVSEMQAVEKFLSDFRFLSFGRDFVFCGSTSFSLQMLSGSCELTVGSIISCCESGCMADAYSLLRKYRDDLFFYLYVVVCDTYSMLDHKLAVVSQMEANIERWINNDLGDLHIGTVLQTVGQSPRVKNAIQKYNLKPYFDTLGNKLNNYVHGNGISFYNRNVNAYEETGLRAQIQSLQRDVRSITISFLFLLILCSPLFIMSTDFVDYLDCNTIPPKNSQYWVAPFVTAFFKRNIELIDDSLIEYLKDNTIMEFN